MCTILDKLAAHARERVAADKTRVPQATLEALCAAGATPPREPHAFATALRRGAAADNAAGGLAFICEVKRASPSKGMIAQDFPHVDIACDYAAAGADAISCLTEPKWFLGSDALFRDIRGAVSTPLLRKDFTVDIYQIYQAKCMGADAVLLICALLPPAVLRRFLTLCNSLRLDALVEAHDAEEVQMAVDAGAQIIGVNNRNLKDFTVDTENSRRLRALAPKDALFVSESGISAAKDIPPLREAGVDAVLIGEALMRAADKRAFLQELRSA